MRILPLLFVFLCACSSEVDQPVSFNSKDIEGIKVIASVKYPNHYLSIDNGEYFGSTYGEQPKISVTQQIGQQEKFKITKYRDAIDIYCIESMDIRERYLILDGAAVKPTTTKPGGRVGANIYIGQYGQFKIKPFTDSTYTFESVFFPGRYLSMSQDQVNAFNKIGAEEQFLLLEVEDI